MYLYNIYYCILALNLLTKTGKMFSMIYMNKKKIKVLKQLY